MLRRTEAAANAMLNAITAEGPFKINYYTGSQPAAASDAATGTLLVTVSNNGADTGVTFDPAANAELPKAAAETWSGTAVATGTAGWWRLYKASDDPAGASTTMFRIDGSIATSGAELNMSHTSVATGAIETLSDFVLRLPE